MSDLRPARRRVPRGRINNLAVNKAPPFVVTEYGPFVPGNAGEAQIDHGATECRIRMWLNGYRPMRIPNGKKTPRDTGWPDHAMQEPPRCVTEPLSFEHLSTGMLGKGLRLVDVDVGDRGRADAIIALAKKMLGKAPMRWRGNSPRVALMYRAAEGEPKKLYTRNAPILVKADPTIPGSKDVFDLIEVLGSGSQLHVDGLHPSGAELEWQDGSPWETPRADLTAVTEAQVMAFLVEAAKIIGAEPPPEPKPRDAVVPKSTANDARIGEGRLRRVLAYSEPFVRDDWVTMAHHLCAAVVLNDATYAPLADDEVLAMFDRWSSGELWAAAPPGDRLSRCDAGVYQGSEDVENLWRWCQNANKTPNVGAVVAMAQSHAGKLGQTVPNDICHQTMFELENYVPPAADTAAPVKRNKLMFGASILDAIQAQPPALIADMAGPGELTILSGDRGTGKSAILARMAYAATTGTPCFRNEVSRAGKVLIVAAEGWARTGTDFHAICLSEGGNPHEIMNRCFAAYRGGIRINDTDGQVELFRVLAQFTEHFGEPPAMLALDTARKSMSGSVSDDKDVNRLTIVFDKIWDMYPNIAIVALAHVAKGRQGMSTKGSTDWEQGADYVLWVEGKVRDGKTKLTYEKVKAGRDGRWVEIKYVTHDAPGFKQTIVAAAGEDHGYDATDQTSKWVPYDAAVVEYLDSYFGDDVEASAIARIAVLAVCSDLATEPLKAATEAARYRKHLVREFAKPPLSKYVVDVTKSGEASTFRNPAQNGRNGNAPKRRRQRAG